jgi:hypothetical protein
VKIPELEHARSARPVSIFITFHVARQGHALLSANYFPFLEVTRLSGVAVHFEVG